MAHSPRPSRRARVVAICWFRREDYEAAKAGMADPERLYAGYDAWLKEAQAFETQMAADGVKTTRVRFDPTGFALYCVTRGLPPDGVARAEWANLEARRKVDPSL